MKISRDLQAKTKSGGSRKAKSSQPPASFDGMVRREGDRLRVEELDRLFADLEKQGEQLLQSRTFTEFLRFKDKVRQFLHEAVTVGMRLRRKREFHPHSGTRTLTTVEQVNRQLEQMTRHFLGEQKQSIDLLAKIGEIEGLLLNLYR
ncbi:MAG TPA: YaaR family protein [Bacillales bacterium]|nr:YaaR family protein [Bacillales bacterium]